jgi:hypothetical protein
MAAPNKVTAVHITLIVFVMITIILGVVTYIFLNEGSELRTALAKAESEAKTHRDANLKNLDRIETLKKLLFGTNSPPEVGDPSTPNTVAGELAKQMTEAGKRLQPGIEPTLSAHLLGLRAQVDTLAAANAELKNGQTKLETDLQTLRDQYSAEVAQYRQAAEASAADNQNLIARQTEITDAKDAEIARLEADSARLAGELDQTQVAFAAYRDEAEKSKTNLIRINNRLLERYEEATKLSFEVADGEIRRVDNLTQVVYINLGEADHLPLRTTFSVYRKNHQGVGRGTEDIKGAIEVTRIIDDHLAEARITDQDYYDPIAPGDPIYSPLWEVGRKEQFAIVGTIDLDGDGESDRDLLHQIVNSAGAEIQHEVNDEGERIPADGSIDDTTKFLVVGSIPDPAQLATDPEQEAAVRVGDYHLKMREEAREHGVRTITLHDLMNYMGYKPQRRVWRPGEQRPYSLKAGSRSTAVTEQIGESRRGSGETSTRFGNTSRLKPPTSNGLNDLNGLNGGESRNGR